MAFRTTEAAVFATFRALNNRAGSNNFGRAEDIILALDHLYRRLRIRLAHARVLRTWGERGVAPDPTETDHALWTEAIAALDVALKKKGIVA